MRSTLMTVMALTLTLLLVGCGDDDTPPPGSDGPVTQDTGVTPDTGVTGDGPVTTQDKGPPQEAGTIQDKGTTPGDTGTAKWDGTTKKFNCGEIGLCSNACAKSCTGAIKFGCLMKCQTDCKAKACASALPIYKPLSDCVTAKCTMSCINGPTPACHTCVTTKCAAQTKTCNAHKC